MENSTLDESHKIYGADQMKNTEFKGHKNESFIVNIDQFASLLPEKDVNANSRITLQKNVSRKGMQRGTEQKSYLSSNNDRNHSPRATSTRGALQGTSTPEKAMVSVVGPTENSTKLQHHNSITIMNSCGGGSATVVAAEGKLGGRRYSFRRPSSYWTIDPRRILFLFATLSSMGTILLIYFTLSMSKFKGDDTLLI